MFKNASLILFFIFLSAPTYQWFHNETKIENNSDTLIIDSVSQKDSGEYYCVVDGTTSSQTVLYVNKIVNFNYSGESDGSFDKPYSSLKEAIGNSKEPVFLKIQEGQTSETIRINTPVRIESSGTVRIGVLK